MKRKKRCKPNKGHIHDIKTPLFPSPLAIELVLSLALTLSPR